MPTRFHWRFTIAFLFAVAMVFALLEFQHPVPQTTKLPDSQGLSMVNQMKRIFSDQKLVKNRREPWNQPWNQCKLPSHARWCLVLVKGGPQFYMAVYSGVDIVSESICKQGWWETETALSFGTPGNALDIGGNLGYFSFLLANVGWHVDTFEPLPRNLELINATACKNPHLAKNIKVHGVGLGAHNDTCIFMSGVDNVGDGSVRCGSDGVHEVPSGYQVRGTFVIQKLDDILTAFDSRTLEFVKIDVEGYECQVFEGGMSLLTKFRPRLIQTEVWNSPMKMEGCSAEGYLNLFRKHQYMITKDAGCRSHNSMLSSHAQDFFMCDDLKHHQIQKTSQL